MAAYLRCDRLGRYAEIRPYDGQWTLLAGERRHATPFKTRQEAEAAIPAVAAACGDSWRVTAEDLRVVADENVAHVEQHRDYVRRFFADKDVA